MLTRLHKKAKTTSAHAAVVERQPDAAPVVHTSALPAKAIVQYLRGIPLHLVKYIFDEQMGAIGDIYYANHIPYAPTSIDKAMPELALVSRGWFKVISQITREYEAANGFFSFKDGSEDEVEAFYAHMEQRGPHLTNLELSLSYGLGYSRLTLPQRFVILNRVDALEIDWHRAFRHCLKLLRLDLGSMLLHSKQLGKVLAAASTHCPQVQALILPMTELPVLNHTKLQPNFAQLYRAMKRWHKGSLNRGLLQLTVPHRVDPSDGHDKRLMRYTDEYLTAIAEHCPNLEYLDGGQVTNRTVFRNYSEEMLFCSLEAWENFCRSCTRLRVFDWFYAPLDDRFLKIFGKYRKPQLTRMTLACGNEDRWEDGSSSGTRRDDGGDGALFFGLVSDLLEKLVSLPITAEILYSFNVKLTIPYIFIVENHDVVRKRLETCAHKFTHQFPRYLLRFASSTWPVGQKNVPDDLTEIYYVWIDTEGYKRWRSLS